MLGVLLADELPFEHVDHLRVEAGFRVAGIAANRPGVSNKGSITVHSRGEFRHRSRDKT